MEVSTHAPFQRRSNAYIQRMADDMRIRNFAASTIAWTAQRQRLN